MRAQSFIIFVDKSALNEFPGHINKPKKYDELLDVYEKMHKQTGAGMGLDYFKEFILPVNLSAIGKTR